MEEQAAKKARVEGTLAQPRCPHLDTINRASLDFDMSKVCSVSLSTLNVYCCLVCGTFFQGRGSHTPCYTHSVQAGHFVFIQLHTGKMYCLPDGYEVVDSSLLDIRRCLHPSYTRQEVEALRHNKALARDIHGVAYLPGFIGLNRVNPGGDGVNTVLHTLAHIEPLRDFFLLMPEEQQQSHETRPLLRRFGELVRKMWSPHNFKSVLSPQELVGTMASAAAASSSSSKGRSKIALDGTTDTIDLWSWLLGELLAGAVELDKRQHGEISDCLSGVVEVTETKPGSSSSSSKSVNFKHLSLALPSAPLFRDAEGGLVIPRVPIFDLLTKFDGRTETEDPKSGVRRTYKIRKLPRYLVFNLDRWGGPQQQQQQQTGGGGGARERNRTIVTFPVRNLELRDLVLPHNSGNETDFGGRTKYDLVASLCCRAGDAPAGEIVSIGPQAGPPAVADSTASSSSSASASASASAATHAVHLHNKATDQWFEIMDLSVSETTPHQVAQAEAHLLVYELQAL